VGITGYFSSSEISKFSPQGGLPMVAHPLPQGKGGLHLSKNRGDIAAPKKFGLVRSSAPHHDRN